MGGGKMTKDMEDLIVVPDSTELNPIVLDSDDSGVKNMIQYKRSKKKKHQSCVKDELFCEPTDDCIEKPKHISKVQDEGMSRKRRIKIVSPAKVKKTGTGRRKCVQKTLFDMTCRQENINIKSKDGSDNIEIREVGDKRPDVKDIADDDIEFSSTEEDDNGKCVQVNKGKGKMRIDTFIGGKDVNVDSKKVSDTVEDDIESSSSEEDDKAKCLRVKKGKGKMQTDTCVGDKEVNIKSKKVSKRRPRKMYNNWLNNRFPPSLMSDAIKELSDNQRRWLIMTGFEHLLEFRLKRTPNALAYEIMMSMNIEESCFQFGDTRLEFSEADVHEVLGLPRGHKKISFVNDDESAQIWRDQFLDVGKSKSITCTMVSEAIISSKKVNKYFKYNFLILLANTIIEESVNTYVKDEFLHFDGDVNKCYEYNFCEYVIETLKTSVETWRIDPAKRFFKGSVPFPVLLYVDRIVNSKRKIKRCFPTFIGWTDEMLAAREARDLSNGEFGKGRLASALRNKQKGEDSSFEDDSWDRDDNMDEVCSTQMIVSTEVVDVNSNVVNTEKEVERSEGLADVTDVVCHQENLSHKDTADLIKKDDKMKEVCKTQSIVSTEVISSDKEVEINQGVAVGSHEVEHEGILEQKDTNYLTEKDDNMDDVCCTQLTVSTELVDGNSKLVSSEKEVGHEEIRTQKDADDLIQRVCSEINSEADIEEGWTMVMMENLTLYKRFQLKIINDMSKAEDSLGNCDILSDLIAEFRNLNIEANSVFLGYSKNGSQSIVKVSEQANITTVGKEPHCSEELNVTNDGHNLMSNVSPSSIDYTTPQCSKQKNIDSDFGMPSFELFSPDFLDDQTVVHRDPVDLLKHKTLEKKVHWADQKIDNKANIVQDARIANVSHDRPRRLVKPAANQCSPYFIRPTNIRLGHETREEKYLWMWIHSGQIIPTSILFKWMDVECQNFQFRSLMFDTDIISTVIDTWSCYLNLMEYRKSSASPRRLFCTTKMMTGEYLGIISDRVDVGLRMFSEKMDKILKLYNFQISLIDMVFFPIQDVKGFYVVCYNLKNPAIEIIDNEISEGTIQDHYNGRIAQLNKYFVAYLADNECYKVRDIIKLQPVRMRMTWQTKHNFADSGIFTMRHMEIYKGEGDNKWDSGFRPEGMTQNRQIKRLRIAFLHKMIMFESNILKRDMMKGLAAYMRIAGPCQANV